MNQHNPAPDTPHLDEVQLNEYLDGCLVSSEISAFEAHLESCSDCASRLENLQFVFSGLQTLPEISLERDLSRAIATAIQPRLRFSERLKWGALTQLILAFVVLMFSTPWLLKTWKLAMEEVRPTFRIPLSAHWMTFATELSTQLGELQSYWLRPLNEWQFPSIVTTTQIVVWPIFLAAILLFIVGNGLLLRQITRNGTHG